MDRLEVGIDEEHPEESKYQNAEYGIKHRQNRVSEGGNGVTQNSAYGGDEVYGEYVVHSDVPILDSFKFTGEI